MFLWKFCDAVAFALTAFWGKTRMEAGSSTGNPDFEAANSAASIVGVRPLQPAPRIVKRMAWKIEKTMLQCVSWFDVPDSSLSLRVLWWKAIFGNDKTSPVFDNGLAYDMLPGFVRLLVHKIFVPLYPRWTHAVIEIRTAYLDTAVKRIAAAAKSRDPTTKIRLISIGGGYDIRSIKLENIIDEAVELDLPVVVNAKRKLLHRFQRRRPSYKMRTKLYDIDLQRLDDVRHLLKSILGNSSNDSMWHNILLFEGVLMYLDKGIPMKLLATLRQAVSDHSASLCFADAILKDSDERKFAELELSKAGWTIVDWLVKGGRTRHMGIAEKKPATQVSEDELVVANRQTLSPDLQEI